MSKQSVLCIFQFFSIILFTDIKPKPATFCESFGKLSGVFPSTHIWKFLGIIKFKMSFIKSITESHNFLTVGHDHNKWPSVPTWPHPCQHRSDTLGFFFFLCCWSYIGSMKNFHLNNFVMNTF